MKVHVDPINKNPRYYILEAKILTNVELHIKDSEDSWVMAMLTRKEVEGLILTLQRCLE